MKEKEMYTVSEVCKILEVSESQSYKIIRGLRIQLAKEREVPLNLLPAGKIPAKYFLSKIGLI